MTKRSPSPKAVEVQLKQQLAQLQQSASVVAAMIFKTDKGLYEHLAELYMWWRSASQVPGYLEAEYSKTGKKYKRKVKHGINFAPLFWLTWGHYNGLTDDKCRRWSIVLNKFDALYESEKQYHTDSVEKLKNFLHTNGGVDGIVNDGKVIDDELDDDELSDDEFDAALAYEAPPLDLNTKLALLYGTAKEFYSAASNPTTAAFNFTIPVSEDGMGVVLVRKVGDAYQLVGVSNDEALVKPAALQTYLHDFSALPPSICAIVETLSTQCLPKHLQAFYASLVDTAAMDTGLVAKKSVRRLTFMHDTGEFLLSPMHAVSGVVTVAKPRRPVLANATKDVFLATKSRRAIERRLICERDFNLYVPTSTSIFPEYPTSNLASHGLRLENRFEQGDFLHLCFWPFYKGVERPRTQLVAGSDSAGFGTWRGTLSLAWFRKFAVQFTSLWLAHHGQHIKRPHQQVFMLTFETDALTTYYRYQDGKFEHDERIGFDGAATEGKAIGVCVLTKDFAVAMQAIADLSVVTPVTVGVDDDLLAIRFATAAAGYRVYIPTCSVDGERSSKHFKSYQPTQTPVVVDSIEDYFDPADVDGPERR